MNIDTRRYINRLPQQLTKVKLLIMLTLLEAGNQFPKGWIESSKLRYLTNLKSFDRYVHELRDELGCDIEEQDIRGEICYRLRSEELLKPLVKEEPQQSALASSQKEALLLFAKNSCQVCGVQAAAGKAELREDLKVPLLRGGSKEFENWHILCDDCIVAKKLACAGCDASCKECPWAFPEEAGRLALVKLPRALVQRLADNGIVDRGDIGRAIITALEQKVMAEPSRR